MLSPRYRGFGQSMQDAMNSMNNWYANREQQQLQRQEFEAREKYYEQQHKDAELARREAVDRAIADREWEKEMEIQRTLQRQEEALLKHEYEMKEIQARSKNEGNNAPTYLTPDDDGFWDDAGSVDHYNKIQGNKEKARGYIANENERIATGREEMKNLTGKLGGVVGGIVENNSKIADGDKKDGDFMGMGGEPRDALADRFNDEAIELLQQISEIPEEMRTPDTQRKIIQSLLQLPDDQIKLFFEASGMTAAEVSQQVEQMYRSGVIDMQTAQKVSSAFGY